MACNTQEEGRGPRQGRQQPRANDLEDILAGHAEPKLADSEQEEFLLRPGLARDGTVWRLPERTLEGSIGQGAKVSGG
jgi:hypothetical protein